MSGGLDSKLVLWDLKALKNLGSDISFSVSP